MVWGIIDRQIDSLCRSYDVKREKTPVFFTHHVSRFRSEYDFFGQLSVEQAQLAGAGHALGAGFQRCDIAIREMQPHHAVEEFGGFGGGEAQVGRAQFGHLPPSAVAGQRQRRILTGGDDQVHLRRLALKQEGESVVDGGRRIDRFGINQVVVVKDEATRRRR
jgi:hypothetical protein